MKNLTKNQIEILEKAEGCLITFNLSGQIEKYKTGLILLQEIFCNGLKGLEFYEIPNWLELHKYLKIKYPNLKDINL